MNVELIQNITSSAIFLIAWVVFKSMIQRSFTKWRFKAPENRLRWLVHIRNLMFFGLVFGLILIWASAIKAFALSVVVIASAIAISCKEYIMCFLGGLLKATSNYFVVGDRIIINDFRGDVINHTPFSTTLFEVGPETKHHQYTGRKIILPNSLFLISPLINETHGSKYTFHTFKISVERSSDWRSLKERIEQASLEVCSDFIENAQKYFDYLAEKGDLEPRVTPKSCGLI